MLSAQACYRPTADEVRKLLASFDASTGKLNPKAADDDDDDDEEVPDTGGASSSGAPPAAPPLPKAKAKAQAKVSRGSPKTAAVAKPPVQKKTKK